MSTEPRASNRTIRFHAPTTPVIAATGLSKVYETGSTRIVAFQDVSFSIHNREFVIVIGPSGCGKSTLLKILGGLTEPSSGNLLVEQGSESEFRVATVFQDAALFPWMRAFDNASFGLRLNGQSKGERRARARKELARVGLEGFEQAYPSELSGGMRQRVNLARALCIDPHLMLMDEPFAALDVQTKMVMQEQLLEIWERDRRTVVFVTHSIMEALVLGDRILVMGTNPGRLIAEIDVPFDRPRTPNEIRYDPEFLRLERELENMIRLQYRDGTHVEGFGAANA